MQKQSVFIISSFMKRDYKKILKFIPYLSWKYTLGNTKGTVTSRKKKFLELLRVIWEMDFKELHSVCSEGSQATPTPFNIG